MNSISFEKVLSALSSKPIKMPTLGRESTIEVSRIGDQIHIEYGSMGNNGTVGVRDWESVMQRLDSLEPNQQEEASRYTDPNWPGRPDRVLSPYLPAIVRFFQMEFSNSKS